MTKIALGDPLIPYHVFGAHVIRDFQNERNHHTHVYYRWYNNPLSTSGSYCSPVRRQTLLITGKLALLLESESGSILI